MAGNSIGDFSATSFKISRLLTQQYSTSFSLATTFFPKAIKQAIYSIYGFVRVADEIVDTFLEFDKPTLLTNFERDYYESLKQGISTNPILNSFQETVRTYKIDDELIQAFFLSMKRDLELVEFTDENEIATYVYGSADVIGLMCLKVFCNGDDEQYNALKTPAMKLGSAFQKVNFLRDLNDDINTLNRSYFPEISNHRFNDETKKLIIQNIEHEFKEAFSGIIQLPRGTKLPVYIAYTYYKKLLKKIKRTPANVIMNQRLRISNSQKTGLLVKAVVKYNFGLIS